MTDIFIISLNIIKALVNAMQMISVEEWSVVIARVAVSNSREKERGCLARGRGNPPGYAPMHSRSRLLVLRSSEPGFVYRKLAEIPHATIGGEQND